MRRGVALVLAGGLIACSEAPTDVGAPITVQIISPATSDRLHNLDPMLLLGTATASTVGLIPEDSIWWTDNGDTLGYGSRIETRALSGGHQFVLHARYGASRDSASRTAFVLPDGLGRVLWTVPLGSAWQSSGLTILAGGALVAREGYGGIAIITPDGSVIAREDLDGALSNSPVTATADGGFVSGDYEVGVRKFLPAGWVGWHFSPDQQGTGAHHLHGGISVDAAGTSYFISGEREAPIWAVSADGTLRWRSETQPDGTYENWNWTVLVGDSLVVASLRRDSIVALSAFDGTRRWILAGAPWQNAWRYVAAVGACGTVYTGGWEQPVPDPLLMAIAPDGSIVWKIDVPGYPFPFYPVVGTSRIYIAWVSGTFLAVSLDGTSRDTLGTPPMITSGYGVPYWYTGASAGVTLGANDVLYINGVDTLYSFTADGARRFAVAVDPCEYCDLSFGPVIGSDGTLYLRTGSGVTAFRDTVGPSNDAPWPTFQGNFQRTGRVATGTCTR